MLPVGSEYSLGLSEAFGAEGRIGAVSSFDSVLPPTTVSLGTTDGTDSHPMSTKDGRIDGLRGGRVMGPCSVAPDRPSS